MNTRQIVNRVTALCLLVACAVSMPARADDNRQPFPPGATFSTLITTPLGIEGMTGDRQGNLYVPGRVTTPGAECPVWRINIDKPALVPVGRIPAPSATGLCAPLGLAFDQGGKLYVADGDRIMRAISGSRSTSVMRWWA